MKNTAISSIFLVFILFAIASSAASDNTIGQNLSSNNRLNETDIEANMRQDAQTYFEEAKHLYIIPDCINSSDRAGKSKELYTKLYNNSQEEEKNLPSSQQVKSKLYLSNLQELDALLSKIKDICQPPSPYILKEYYRKAQEYYLSNDLVKALEYASTSRNLSLRSRDYAGVSRCDVLLGQINLRINKSREANISRNRALEIDAAGDYDGALTEANKSLNFYKTIFDKDNEKRTDDLIQYIDSNKVKLEAANRHYLKSQEYMKSANYTGAQAEAKNARTLYSEIHHSLGIEESSRVMEEAQQKINQQDLTYRNTLSLTLAIILVAVIIAAYALIKRKKKTEKSRLPPT